MGRAALGYQFARRHGAARRILEPLLERFPDIEVFRLDLASSYSQTECVELCRYHLGYLAEHGATEEWREVGRRRSLPSKRTPLGARRLITPLVLDAVEQNVSAGVCPEGCEPHASPLRTDA